MRERPAKSGRWELRAYVGRDPETRKPRQVSRVFRGGKREAIKALDRLVREVDEGQHVGTGATFGKLLDEWMQRIICKRRARSTVETYTIHIEKHIRPALGPVRLHKLTAYEIDAYIADLEAKGLAGGTIKLQHAIIRSALSQGVRWKWIPSNPAKESSPEVVGADAAPTITVDQLRTLYSAAAVEDEDMAAAIALAALTGCRRGELCGIKWSDVDWTRASIQVERAWVPGSGGQHLTQTKTGKGRTVFVGSEGLRILRGYRAAKTDQLGHEPSDGGWLISYDGGDTPLRAKTLTEYVHALGRRNKIKIRLHSLRHFKATELNRAGVDLPTAAGQMGHTPAVMAQTYLHTDDDRQQAAGELAAGSIGKALTATPDLRFARKSTDD
jgi:integrase